MALLNVIYLFIIFHKIYAFCEQLRYGFSLYNADASDRVVCGYLFDEYSMVKYSKFSPWLNYNFLQAFVILSALLWFVALIVMIARIVFVVDFQLIRVCITLVERSDKPIRSIDLDDIAQLETLRRPLEINASASSWDIKWGPLNQVKLLEPEKSNTTTVKKGESQVSNKETILFNAPYDNDFKIIKEKSPNKQKHVTLPEIVVHDFALSKNPEFKAIATRNSIVLQRKPKPPINLVVDSTRLKTLKNRIAKEKAHNAMVDSSKYYVSSLEDLEDLEDLEESCSVSDSQNELSRQSSRTLNVRPQIPNKHRKRAREMSTIRKPSLDEKISKTLPTIQENSDELAIEKQATALPNPEHLQSKKIETEKRSPKHRAKEDPKTDETKPKNMDTDQPKISKEDKQLQTTFKYW